MGATPSVVSDDRSIDPDETFFLPGEIAIRTARWNNDVPMYLRRPEFKEMEIKDLPFSDAFFTPIRTSSRLELNKLPSEEKQPQPTISTQRYDRYLKECAKNVGPVRGKARRNLEACSGKCCKGYYEAAKLSDEDVQSVSRHRLQPGTLPRPPTPENYYNPSWWYD